MQAKKNQVAKNFFEKSEVNADKNELGIEKGARKTYSLCHVNVFNQ